MNNYDSPLSPMFKTFLKTLAILLLIIVASCSLLGCGPATTKNTTTAWKLPDELSHCSVYKMTDENGSDMKVVHCPSSTTTTGYKEGKNSRKFNVVIDNETYELVKKNDK
jgi:hypothetical protein